MEFRHHTVLNGIVEIIPRIFRDERGVFWESFSGPQMEAAGLPAPQEYVQDNHSVSKKGVLRGLHFQNEPAAQGKLVRCTNGSVLDIVVDIRPTSPTFGQHAKFLLTAEAGNMLWVPKGFAHGFLALADDTVFMYRCTHLYNKAAEGGLLWNDPNLKIDWQLLEHGIHNPIVSSKDQELPTWNIWLQA